MGEPSFHIASGPSDRDIGPLPPPPPPPVDPVVVARLAAPFEPSDLEWRLLRSGKGDRGIWAVCIPYFTRHALINRFDDVVGAGNWQTDIRLTQSHVLAGIGVRVAGEWIWRWDGSGLLAGRGESFTAADAGKGDVSMALKRAAEQWGVGLYLREIPEQWAIINQNGRHKGAVRSRDGKVSDRFRWDPPELPSGQPSRPGSMPRGEPPAPAGGRAEPPAGPDPAPSGPSPSTPEQRAAQRQNRIEAVQAEVREFMRKARLRAYHLDAVIRTDKNVPDALSEFDLPDWEYVRDVCRRHPIRFEEAPRLLSSEFPIQPEQIQLLDKLILEKKVTGTEVVEIGAARATGFSDAIEYWLEKLRTREPA